MLAKSMTSGAGLVDGKYNFRSSNELQKHGQEGGWPPGSCQVVRNRCEGKVSNSSLKH